MLTSLKAPAQEAGGNVSSGGVEFHAVSKTFPDGTQALDAISLHCPAGETTVFVGPSGCGKTTALRMINKMVLPSRGHVTVNGVDVASMATMELRRQIGYVIQNAGLFPHKRVIDNVALIPRLLGEAKSTARDRAAELLKLVGLPVELGRKYPHQLSGGQQQRVGVARALAADPPILLMDEPFSAVDPIVRRDLQNHLKGLQGELRKTIIMVTHDLDEAVFLADQVVVFRPGAVAQVDSPGSILTAPADDYVEGFTKGNAGIKWLSLLPTEGLLLEPVSSDAGAETRAASGWVLQNDDDGRPESWIQAGTPGATGGQGPIPVRSPFVYGVDTLNSALNSAVLSPAGKAVAVDSHGRTRGLVDAREIHAAVRIAKGNDND
ncbi:ATP-binding cassette domain-containing protein [Arthrobacter sp. StoSoilB5]|uniref:ABC transporter ATP-binding protein n=1 Tax=Arthrobacter sp. StoSoilB5 TaxID=2830992 RepID=UPI001E794A6E|nr:ATP-binding cassette domain-containing protein [Arthrobacter sp. StoSoilB5]BCW44930.1 proline/glycine betaine ABC transporter ATP-binding protein [Arthrobacter sp. StoSoilB5]